MARETATPPDDFAYNAVLYTMILDRRYNEVIAKIRHDLEQAGDTVPPILLTTAKMNIGMVHRAAGRESEGRAALIQVEAELTALRGQGNASPILYGTLLHVHGYLGRREEVDREAPEHIARQAKDRRLGPVAEEDAARAFALVGENERALSLLKRLALTSYADSFTPATLRLDPVWDKIRQEPRFQKLAEAKP